jgi:hypothetical protein
MLTDHAILAAATVTASITTAAAASDARTKPSYTDDATTATATAVVAVQGMKPARSYCVIQQGIFQRMTEVESKKADPA